MKQLARSASTDVLASPPGQARRLTTEDRRDIDLSQAIAGWGSDLDPDARPGVPRDKAPGIGAESLYPPIERQVSNIKIHKSTEHPRLTPVFGTSCPPRGVSGAIRDIGYRFSEGRLTHWLMLMLADRVDVIEALVSDLSRGHVPNLVDEMGLRSELAHNRAGVARKAAIAGVCVFALVAWSRARRPRRAARLRSAR